MSIYGHPLFWSAIACVLAAVVVCILVVRYGFTRDSDPAGRWGWRPTRAGHGIAAALFGTGVALAILALTASPLGGYERHPGLGDALRARLEALRGRLGAFEHAVARLGEEGMRRVLPPERRQALSSPPRAESVRAQSVRGQIAHPAGDSVVATTLLADVPRRTAIDGGHAAIGTPPVLARSQPPTILEPRATSQRPASDRDERRAQPERTTPAGPPPEPAPVEIAPRSVPPASTPPIASRHR